MSANANVSEYVGAIVARRALTMRDLHRPVRDQRFPPRDGAVKASMGTLDGPNRSDNASIGLHALRDRPDEASIGVHTARDRPDEASIGLHTPRDRPDNGSNRFDQR
jgi:hypothetical protein